MPPSVDHEIKIARMGKDAVPPRPMPVMNIGETVRYSSNDGTVKIEFHDNGSPFQETDINDGQIVKVQNSGTFLCRCFITLFIPLQDGTTAVGWVAHPSLSGADHDVPKK